MDDLLAKIRRVGVPLAEFAGVKPYYGIKTGLNEAFLIDTPTKNHLIRDDPNAAEIIKPYLRGQDIKRWSPQWAGLWMIFTRRGIDIDAYPAIKKYLLQFHEQLEPRPKDWKGEEWSGRKPGSYQWYELQDAVDYWPLFERPKIMYQEIQFHPAYCFDTGNIFSNNKVFILPSADTYLLAVLNSPLMWWHNWRYLPHMKDEALSTIGVKMEALPIASPTDVIRVGAEQAVGRLIKITRARHEARRLMVDWLRTEFDVQESGAALEDFSTLALHAFVEEVRKHRAKTAGKLTPAALRDLQNGYTEQIAPIQRHRAEAMALERELSDLINAAYGLTPEETALLWTTVPPRMPLSPQHWSNRDV